MNPSPWHIPESNLRWIAQIPADRPVAMLIRHSVRGPLAEGDAGYHMPLTDEGHTLARDLGRLLSGRLRSARSSPLLRTMQTAERLLEGAGLQSMALPDTMLGDPGVFMLDRRAGSHWRDLGHEGMMTRLVEDQPPLPGCAAADPAARFLVHTMLACARGAPGLHAFVTHDSLVTATAARMLRRPLTRDDWPMYLEAAFFWEEDGAVHTAYQDLHGERPAPLVGLTTEDVIHLARREVAATTGLDVPARFFLAGGAFKTLLTGRPPRDLDIWAPTPQDRAALEDRLIRRGAERLPDQPYTQGFHLNGRRVELSLHTGSDTLEGQLARFDLALSAIGAEYILEDQWRAAIHPLAHTSVRQRRILLLDELQSWRHSLTSLERMRRYATELGFESPAVEEARIWDIFDAQMPEMQQGMIERYRKNARHDQGIMEEINHRLAIP